LTLSTCALGEGWVGQGRVNRPNGDTSDQQPVVGVDRNGKPWVVWNTNATDTSLFYSTWNGTGWGWGRAVSANDSGVWGRLRPDLALDEQDRAWLVWDNGCWDNSSVIAGCHWEDSQWSEEQQVSPADSTDLYFAPKVSCGGGRVWCVWYGGPTDTSPYSIYASKWDGVAQVWQPETRVSPADGNEHWWCDVAVDSMGTPHVVWCTYPLYTVFYSYSDGQGWVVPVPVNDMTATASCTSRSPARVSERLTATSSTRTTTVLVGHHARWSLRTACTTSGTRTLRLTAVTMSG
jgi:hypothetical protein